MHLYHQQANEQRPNTAKNNISFNRNDMSPPPPTLLPQEIYPPDIIL